MKTHVIVHIIHGIQLSYSCWRMAGRSAAPASVAAGRCDSQSLTYGLMVMVM
jgi:hypothetical protein